MRDPILNFLFNESQIVAADEDAFDHIAELLEALADTEALEVRAKPLAAALKEIGLDSYELDLGPEEMHLNLGCAEAFNEALTLLSEPDAFCNLAALGWVAVPSGSDYTIHFIGATESEADGEENPSKAANLEKLMSDAAEDIFSAPESNQTLYDKEGEVEESAEKLVRRMLEEETE